jgi:FkbM family methyltransferase
MIPVQKSAIAPSDRRSTEELSMSGQRLPNAVSADRADALVYFLHVPKTGGVSLSTFLESLFTESELWSRGRGRIWSSLIQQPSEALKRLQLIDGHFGGYLYKHYPLPLRYFTFLRDPLWRAVSHFEHVRRDQAHYYHGLARELGSFGAYLRDERTQPTVVNFQLRSIGATFDPATIAARLTPDQIAKFELEKQLDTMPMPEPLDELLRCAQARLEQMCFVGITERFADSLGLLCEIFSWPIPSDIAVQNANPLGTSVANLPREDIELFNRLNQAEIELYQAAKSRFERDWARSRFVYPHLHAFVSFAQNAEDVLLYRALRDAGPGTYVDVGANDPCGDSVTKAFYDRGWRGINIEPVPSLHAALALHRQEDINVFAAAGSVETSKTLYVIAGTGLSTLDASVAERHRVQGFAVSETPVRVRTLDAILAEAPRRDVHFLKIDVEGWEREVLLGIDLAVTRPWIIVIEATEPNTDIPSHGDWEPLLLDRGYRFAFFDGLNRYYLAEERASLLAAFSRPVNCGDLYVRASELNAERALRAAHWRLRRPKQVEEEMQVLRKELAAQVGARATENEAAVQQIDALKKWATSADEYAKSLISELEGLRVYVKSLEDARTSERASAVQEIEALTKWATSADAYAKSLVRECEGLLSQLKSIGEARQAEQESAQQQIAELTKWATSADSYAVSLRAEVEHLRDGWRDEAEARKSFEAQAAALQNCLTNLRQHWAVKLFVNEKHLSPSDGAAS